MAFVSNINTVVLQIQNKYTWHKADWGMYMSVLFAGKTAVVGSTDSTVAKSLQLYTWT